MATTEGSHSTIPRPLTNTRLVAVPRSMARSLEKRPRNALQKSRSPWTSRCCCVVGIRREGCGHPNKPPCPCQRSSTQEKSAWHFSSWTTTRRGRPGHRLQVVKEFRVRFGHGLGPPHDAGPVARQECSHGQTHYRAMIASTFHVPPVQGPAGDRYTILAKQPHLRAERLQALHHRAHPVRFLHAQLAHPPEGGGTPGRSRGHHEHRQLVDQRRHLVRFDRPRA